MIKTGRYEDRIKEIDTLELPKRETIKQEPVFYVNLNTRKVEVPAAFKNIAVLGDYKAETIWFSVDRYFDGVDLSTKNAAIQFENNQIESCLPADYIYNNSHKNTIREDELLIGWTLVHEVTSVPGPLKLSLKIYSGDIETQTFDYVLHSETFSVNIINGLNVTDVSEKLNPPLDTLSSLVNYIATLYRNQSTTGIDYNLNIREDSLPTIDGQMIKGTLESATFLKPDYDKVLNKPTIDDIEIKGQLSSSMFTNINYSQLVEDTLPKINGHTLIGELTDRDLGIEVIVDKELKDSENPIQNSTVNKKFNSVDTAINENKSEIANIKEQLETLTFVPITISNFTNNLKVVELNDISSKDIIFTWETSKTPNEITLNGTQISQSPYTLKTSIINDTTFTLNVKGVAATDVATATTEVKVVKGIFYGAAAAQDSYSEAFVRELGGKILSTESEHIFTVDAGTDLDKYIYIAAPAADLYEFSVKGFTGGFTLVDDSVTLYNNVQYKIYKSDNKNLGITKVKLS
jgi:hypothetical protein